MKYKLYSLRPYSFEVRFNENLLVSYFVDNAGIAGGFGYHNKDAHIFSLAANFRTLEITKYPRRILPSKKRKTLVAEFKKVAHFSRSVSYHRQLRMRETLLNMPS